MRKNVRILAESFIQMDSKIYTSHVGNNMKVEIITDRARFYQILQFMCELDKQYNERENEHPTHLDAIGSCRDVSGANSTNI